MMTGRHIDLLKASARRWPCPRHCPAKPPAHRVGVVGRRRARRTTTDRMTQSMMKTILLALLTFSMRTGAASAQSRTFYDTQKADH